MRFAYKIVKAKSFQKFTEVPVELVAEATLLRARNGHAVLKLQNYVSFSLHNCLYFGDAILKIGFQEHCTVFFQVLKGTVPCKGTVRQTNYILDVQGIAKFFNDF